MRKISAVLVLLTVVVLLEGCATFRSPQVETWAGTTFAVRGEVVYREWEGRAAVKTKEGWLEGSPLPGYSLYDGGKVVFFLLVGGEPKRFEF